MRSKFLFIFFIILLSIASFLFLFTPYKYYLNRILYSDLPVDTTNLPLKNKALLKYAEQNGSFISPSYEKAVCTEYLISIVDNFCPLNQPQKNKIRIITPQSIDTLLKKNSPIPKGVYYALTSSNLGEPIDDIRKAKAGDLVQFWNIRNGKPIGHCGILRAIDIDKGLISLYSSSPRTNGHGKQLYLLPEHLFIVRLK